MYKYNKRNFIDIKQMLYDIICIVVSYFIVSLLCNEDMFLQNLLPNIWIPFLFSILYLCFMYIFDMYNLTTFTYQDRALRDIMLSCIFSYIVCLVMLMFVQPENANKMFFTIFLFIVLFMLISQFILVHEIGKSRNSRKHSRVLMVGSSENIQEYIYYLKKTSFRYNILGYISTDGLYEIPDLTNLGVISSIDSYLTKYTVDEVIFAVHYTKIKEIEQYIVMCENQGLIARVALDFSELNRVNSNIHCVGTIPVLSFQTIARKSFRKFVKRLFDIIISVIGTLIYIIISIPLIPIILVGSGRPIYQSAECLTLNGHYFKLIKFRIDENKLIGRFLKKTGLAGLPQVINVLKGEMSVVGTKPATYADVENFDKNDFRRLGVRPGITGLWVSGDCRSLDNNCDESYIETWKLTKDISIIIKSLFKRTESK